MAATLQRLTVIFAAVAVTACRTEARPATDTETRSGGRSGAGAQCWVAASALLRPEAGGEGADSTWLRLDSLARIVQNDRAFLDGTVEWLHRDSMAVSAFDDLVRLEIRMVLADTIGTGVARLTSDAAVDPRTGQVGLDQVQWISFKRTGCDRMPAAWSDRAGTAGDSVWFSRLVLHDLTRDGRPDSLHLIAIGQRPESLSVTFSVVSGRQARYNASWRSEWYFTYDRPIDSIPAAQLSKRVNDHLNEFFQPEAFGTLSPADSNGAFESLPYEVCGELPGSPVAERAEPSCPHGLIRSVWRDIVAVSPPTFRFFSGGEHTRTIAWSPRLQRFVVIFSCC